MFIFEHLLTFTICSDYDELSEKHKKIESLFQSVESKLLAETAELKESISKKDSEIMELKHELMAATNPKTPSPQKVAVPMEPHPVELLYCLWYLISMIL